MPLLVAHALVYLGDRAYGVFRVVSHTDALVGMLNDVGENFPLKTLLMGLSCKL